MRSRAIKKLIDLYRTLDLHQRGRRFQIVATVLVVIACVSGFGSLLVTSYRLDVQREALVDALTGQNLNADDEHAVTLDRTGEVFVGGRTYGGAIFLDYKHVLFDAEGNVLRPTALAERLLSDYRPEWAPAWMLEQVGTTWLLAVITLVWLLLIIWLGVSLSFVLTALGTAIPVLLAMAFGLEQMALAIAGMGLLTFTFLLLSRVMLALLNRPWQIFAVAHTVVKEAGRTNISLSFIVLLLVLLPLLPVWMDRAAPLQFQVQTFISRSMGVTFFVAACLTLFLACATVAFEIRDRQIWQLMTKPVGRLNYLLGKWLGVIAVNLIILLVSSVSIFTFVQYLRQQPVRAGLEGQLDAQAVREEVLTARSSRAPDYEQLTSEQLSVRMRQVIDRTPELAGLEELPIAVRRQVAQDLMGAFELGQRTIPPGAAREFVFSGLEKVRDVDARLTLRYRFHILRSDEHETFRARFMFNDDPNMILERLYVPTVSHVLSLPRSLVQEDGTLKIAVQNAYQPPPGQRLGYGALNFERDDFELMYKVASFETNFLRAVLLNWIKLSFLAMLGICSATLLNFSVSCLLSFTVFIAGAMGPYLAEALGDWYPPPTNRMDWHNIALVIQWAFQWFIKAIAEVLVFLLQGFGRVSATQMLVEGRYIQWYDVLVNGGLKLGLLWSGLALIIGFLAIRSRQLAIYSGHG